MRKEKYWGNIEKITNQRGVCIRPTGVNHEKAMADFKTNRIRYYSFPVGDSQGTKGYARFITDGNDLYLDFVSPWQGSEQPLKELALRITQRGSHMYIPASNIPESLKTDFQEETLINAEKLGEGVQHRVYMREAERIVARFKK